MNFQKRRVVYEDVDLEAEDVMTIAEAARMLDMSIQGVAAAMGREQLTEIVDPDALTAQGRRLVLRAEVEALAEAKRRAREKWEG